MARTKPSIRNKLLVEGDQDKRVIPELMDKFVVWGETKAEAVVLIEPFGGIEPLLRPGVIEAELNIPNLQALGIIIDADDQRDGRWAAVSRLCRSVVSDFPEELPADGLIHATTTGPRIGVWIMPDNQSTGMLETFLGEMIPTGQDPLWTYAQEARIAARGHGATHSEAHRVKADIHTFLAWVDPPGQQLHTAVLCRSLDVRGPLGRRFARWFVDLFALTPRDPAWLVG